MPTRPYSDDPTDDCINLDIALRRFATAIEESLDLGTPDVPEAELATEYTRERLDIACGELLTEFKHLASENREIREEVTRLRLRLDERSDELPIDFDERVKLVRERAYERAAKQTNGKAQLDYNDIIWDVFDGDLGDPTAYRLLRRAAGVDDEGNRIEDVPGFGFRDDPIRLTVVAAEVDKSIVDSARKDRRGDQ